MFTKKLNTIILIVSQVLTFVIVLYFAVLLAKLVWWVINPSISEVYVEKSSSNQFEKSIKYIINRYPFGVIVKVEEPKNVAPPIASQIKLTGIYYNPPNSIAFIEYSGKAYTVKIGGSIMEEASVSVIDPDQIVITQNGADATIGLSMGSGSAAPASSLEQHRSTTPSHRPDAQTMNQQSFPPSGANSGTSSGDDFKERRRKLIEEFAQQHGNVNNDSSGNQGGQGASGNQGGQGNSGGQGNPTGNNQGNSSQNSDNNQANQNK